MSDLEFTQSLIASMLATLILGVAIAVWLMKQREQSTLLAPLAAFSVGLSLWSLGHVLALLGWQLTLAKLLLLTNPLLPSAFLLFALRFTGATEPTWLAKSLYASCALVIAASFIGDGVTVHNAESGYPLQFGALGWANLSYTVLIGCVAHWLLYRGFINNSQYTPPMVRAEPFADDRLAANQSTTRGAIIGLFIAGSVGFILAAGFVLPNLGWMARPYPMLLLPCYLLAVVYAVFRYQNFAINRYANRVVLWSLVMLVAILLMAGVLAVLHGLGFGLIADIPWYWQLGYNIALFSLAFLVYPKAQRWAESLIYGEVLPSNALSIWLQQLQHGTDWGSWQSACQALWQSQLTGLPALTIVHEAQAESTPDTMDNGTTTNDAIARDALTRDATTAKAPTLRLTPAPNTAELVHCQWLGIPKLHPRMQRRFDLFSQTIELSAQQLAHALAVSQFAQQQLAEQHLRELGSLSAAIAHELRNPLNIIAMASVAPGDHQQLIQSQINRAEHLLKDVLDYAKPSQLYYQPLDFALLCQQVIETNTVLSEWTVPIRLTVPAGQFQLCGDSHRLAQVLQNILANAQSFCHTQANAAIEVLLHDDTEQVVCTLRNNGPALNPAVRDKLFSAFVSRRPGGSGLGLAICKKIIDAHRGHIDFSDHAPWPVQFTLRIPKNPPTGNRVAVESQSNIQELL